MKRRKCTRRIGQNWIPNSGVCERSNNQRDTVTQSIVIVSPRYRYQSSSSYLSRLGKTKGRESKKKDPIQLRSRISFLPPPLRYRAICYDQYHFYPSPISIIAYTVTFLIPLLFSFFFSFFSIDLPSRRFRSYFMDRIKERALAENNCHVIRSDRFTFRKNPRSRIIDNLFSLLDEITANG